MKYLIVFVSILAFASAYSKEEGSSSENSKAQAKFLTTTGSNNNYLALNSTILVVGVAVLLGSIAGLVFVMNSAGLTGGTRRRYTYEQDQSHDNYYNQDYTNRYRRSPHNGKGYYIFTNPH